MPDDLNKTTYPGYSAICSLLGLAELGVLNPVSAGPNHLHGGDKGFDKVIWDAVITDAKDPKLSLSCK